MPEVIEVKQYCDFIKKNIKGDHLIDIQIINGRYHTHKPFQYYKLIKKSLPLRVDDVQSKGKYLYISLDDSFYIGVTLGLTGGWFFQKHHSKNLQHGLDTKRFDSDLSKKYLDMARKHLNVKFEFDSGDLYYYDKLSFGTIKIFTDHDSLMEKLSKIGIDIMDPDTTLDVFRDKLTMKKNLYKPIGNVLIDQKTFSGIGNYLRADALWLSRISPFRLTKDLDDTDLENLYHDIRSLIWGIYNYKKGSKLGIIHPDDIFPSDYNRTFFVYASDYDIYDHKIVKEKLYEGSQIRYIYWVPKYQK